MVTTLILIFGGVLLAALAVIYFSMVRRRQPNSMPDIAAARRTKSGYKVGCLCVADLTKKGC
jgi:prolipoprotein diacylglyceryltransferase